MKLSNYISRYGLLYLLSMTLQTVANQPHAMQMHFEALHVPVVKYFKL